MNPWDILRDLGRANAGKYITNALPKGKMSTPRKWPRLVSSVSRDGLRLDEYDHGNGSECNRYCACHGRGGIIGVLTALTGSLDDTARIAQFLDEMPRRESVPEQSSSAVSEVP